MAKKTIKDLRPNDSVWCLKGTFVTEYKVYSISTEELQIKGELKFKLDDNNLTSWVFMAFNRFETIEFYTNKIDVLRLKHDELERQLKATYDRQQAFFNSIVSQNKLIYDSNIDIINELKNK